MRRQATTLKTRLLLSFVAAALLPLVAAIALAVPWFSSSVQSEAQRALDTHARVASSLFEELVMSYGEQAAMIAQGLRSAEAGAMDRIGAELRREAAAREITLALFVDPSGVVRVATEGPTGRKLEWPEAATLIEDGQTRSAVVIVPQTVLKEFGLDNGLKLEVKETEGGSAPQSEADGALAVVGAAPVNTNRGTTVGTVLTIYTLKKDNAFVDSLVNKVGGVATIFQNGVRVATTVKNDAGERAVGTAISDKVRAAVLGTGKSYVGEAFVVNRDYFTSYKPLFNTRDEVIGMLFVGIDQTPYTTSIRQFALAMGLVVLLAVGIALGFGFVGSQQMAAPFVAVSEAAEKVAGGDLMVVVPQTGFREAVTMGGAFNTMTRALHELIGSVGNSVKGLETVSHEISAAASVEADGATAQASAVAEATATIEELDRSFVAVADGAKRVLEIAEDSLEVADSGRDTVQASAGHIAMLAEGALATREAASNLADVATDIDQVTFVIGSIAEQTKILALNAAIEAARAGEAGRGFGVVATEIRTLADSVSRSVGRIESLVSSIQDASNDLAATAQQQAEMGNISVQESVHTRNKFDEIFERMHRTASAAREIATAAAQQQSAAKQIVQVMHQVSEGVKDTASASHELAQAAGEIQKEARSLAGGLNGFKTQ